MVDAHVGWAVSLHQREYGHRLIAHLSIEYLRRHHAILPDVGSAECGRPRAPGSSTASMRPSRNTNGCSGRGSSSRSITSGMSWVPRVFDQRRDDAQQPCNFSFGPERNIITVTLIASKDAD